MHATLICESWCTQAGLAYRYRSVQILRPVDNLCKTTRRRSIATVPSSSRRNHGLPSICSTQSPRTAYMTLRQASLLSRPGRKVYLALGSNEGDRLANIERACDVMTQHPSMRLVRTSSLYESTPMYYTDQGRFFNAACEIETDLTPVQLLDELQGIERELGRVKSIEKGPRKIDLDILLFEHERIDTERLIIPHKLMHEREFVLRPLADIAPNARIRSVSSSLTIAEYLAELPETDPSLTSLVPYGPGRFLRPQDPRRRTKLMSILNVTPDSFSDGGRNFDTGARSAEKRPHVDLQRTIGSHIQDGADIIDVGGQSSRPKAESIGAAEETSRLQPALTAIEACSSDVPTSIDTYRSDVVRSVFAESQTSNHISIVNDISAGLLDPDILKETAARRVTIVLSHLRGTPETMSNNDHLRYPNGVVEGVATELLERVRAAEEAGIRRWRIILDPGIGFAKNTTLNLELLRGLPRLRSWPGLQGMPWLVGTSRKRFIGELVRQKEAKSGIRNVDDREWGTAATVTAAIAGGADVVRVHSVSEMRDVVDVADAIYRV